ncbi:hypothetical protein D3C87_348030 [compost metagenome]
MRKDQIRSEGDALIYLTDCTLATVEHLASKKSSSKSELKRQIAMAEHAISCIDQFGLDHKNTRVDEVKADGGMQAWVAKIKEKHIK